MSSCYNRKDNCLSRSQLVAGRDAERAKHTTSMHPTGYQDGGCTGMAACFNLTTRLATWCPSNVHATCAVPHCKTFHAVGGQGQSVELCVSIVSDREAECASQEEICDF